MLLDTLIQILINKMLISWMTSFFTFDINFVYIYSLSKSML